MLLFRSEEQLDGWCRAKQHPRGAVLTLAQTWRLAKAWYPDRRSPAWRPRSVEESQAILTALGLTSQFWQLKG